MTDKGDDEYDLIDNMNRVSISTQGSLQTRGSLTRTSMPPAPQGSISDRESQMTLGPAVNNKPPQGFCGGNDDDYAELKTTVSYMRGSDL